MPAYGWLSCGWESDQLAERIQGRACPPIHFHNKFDVFHILMSLAEKFWGKVSEAAVHFFDVEYTTAVKGLPHSKQLAFNRDVINPQAGHILCD
jgi:hypothetical protein